MPGGWEGDFVNVTVRREDIELRERVVSEFSSVVGESDQVVGWQAALDGGLSTGESVWLYRGGGSATEALTKLEAAIAEQGWGITD